MAFPTLPVDAHVAEIRDALARRRAVVVSASPGAGKTTRVAPALIDAGQVILLQPRRVVTRATARRIADERRWTLGREIGWHIRFEKRFGPETRLLVVTEGILTARLQQDPLLSAFTTIIFDEFHERSIHADVGLALARQAWLARDDLRIVVMSATLDVSSVAAFLGDCPVVAVPGAVHPLTVEYRPGESIVDAVGDVLPRTGRQVLCFLPGAREIERARADLRPLLASAHVDVVPLHGSLDNDAQDAAIRPTERRRVILATNIAETSLTVPGVSAVIDTGQVKVARYDAERGIDSLTLERITQDSADQRAGRAARLGPGFVRRLWDARDRLRPRREPDIARIDLAGPLLDLLAWGADLESFEWFEAPNAERAQSAVRLLRRLGAVVGTDDAVRITPLGCQIQRAPLHPRLARILLAGGGAREVAEVCAALAEGPGDPVRVRQTAAELQRVAAEMLGKPVTDGLSEEQLHHALFLGYADRLAKRRIGSADRFILASGHGASLGRAPGAAGPAEAGHYLRNGPAEAGHYGRSGAASAEYIVALDVVAAQRDGISESRIRAASPVEREWIVPTATSVEHRFDRESGRVTATRVERFEAIVLNETFVTPDPAVAAGLLRDAWFDREPDETATQLLRRLRFAGVDIDVRSIVHQAALSARTLEDVDLAAQLSFDAKRSLLAHAPASLVAPSGRAMKLVYAEDGSVSASVKLQELFGLAESPSIGPGRVPVTFNLLAPNGRPVQTTRDLRSFWERTYRDVRKELRGRYPRHPWPEDPWSAQPTHRTTRRR